MYERNSGTVHVRIKKRARERLEVVIRRAGCDQTSTVLRRNVHVPDQRQPVLSFGGAELLVGGSRQRPSNGNLECTTPLDIHVTGR